MRVLFVAGLLFAASAAYAASPLLEGGPIATTKSVTIHSAPPPVPIAPVLMEEMTWQEIRDAVKSGKTTVIVPTGGTEQNGPAIVLGKHNFILRYTAYAIAEKLGNALVAPIMPYVPEGDIHPPTGHMRFAGTLSLPPDHFALFLEDTAASLKEHGFKTICFVGEHGASQEVQKQVAEKLSEQWRSEGVRVIHVGDYYQHNGQNEWLKSIGSTDPDPQAHGGFADTSEMLSVHPQGVRGKLRGPYSSADMDKLGVSGPSDRATAVAGAKLVALKVEAAVKQIQSESKQ